MNTIISWWVGTRAWKIISAVQDFFSGKKTYIITGTGAVVSASNLIVQFSMLPHDPATIVEWARNLTSNPDALVLWHALVFMAGRAAVSKNNPPETVINAKEPPK